MRRSPGISVAEPAEVEIARMRRRHLKGVMAIEKQVYPRPWSPNLFLSEMNEFHNRTYLVAKMGKDVVGYGGVMCYGEEAHITTIAVDPSHHRKKIGTRVLYELIQEGLRLGGEGRVPGGPRVERGGAAPVWPVRVQTGGRSQELLPGDQRGRHCDVGRRHQVSGVSRAAGAAHQQHAPWRSPLTR